VDVPVIGIGGVTSIEDVLDLLAAGASAVGVGVAALADPMLPVRLADELADACRERGLDAVDGLVGTALPARTSAPSTRGAEYAR
jgi:dihydroorotate dehydrogenase (NAD+) catalytic subunit